VLGVASDETVRGAVRAAGKKEVVVDLVGCKSISKRIRELKKAGAKNFEIHTAIDEQLAGKSPFGQLKAASKIRGIKTWVAGGIKAETLGKVMKYRPDVVVVGGAITKAKNPGKAAAEIKKIMGELE
jgi:3-keto-L-gulonate-6-phosphate decarboxylase